MQSYYFNQNTLANAIDPNTGNVGFTSVGEVVSLASSSYHAFQAKISKGMTHGLTFQLAYTFAHALDTGSSYENTGFGENASRGFNQFDPSLNYGNSTYDARQRIVFSPVYVVPYKTGHSAYSPYNLALGGWQVSAITTAATGFPYDISFGGGSSNSLYCSIDFSYYACPDEPNQVGPLVRANPRIRNPNVGSFSQWFTNFSSSFAVAPLGTFGNESRDKYHGPGVNQTNLVLAKNIGFGPDNRYRFQMRLESDNVFNHTQFSNPVSGYYSGIPGYITSSAAARQSQLGAKFYF